MARVAIIGGHGKVALLATPLLVADGHRVTGIIRNPDHAGEVEAAEALNMSRFDTLRYIVIPQGMRVAVPSLMGFSILIFQGTALAYTIALPELLATAYSIGSNTFRYMSVLTLAGFMYVAITVPVSLMTERVERRLSRHL